MLTHDRNPVRIEERIGVWIFVGGWCVSIALLRDKERTEEGRGRHSGHIRQGCILWGWGGRIDRELGLIML